MPEIGQTLSEARIRQRLDIAVVEEQTKIRAKYLRALETEEWQLLPGPAYVKAFLRGYAEYLGLDSQLLVDEYVQRHAGPAEQELFSQYTDPPLAERRVPYRPPRPLSPGAVIAGAVVLVVGFLLVLGLTTGEEDAGKGGDTTTDVASSAPTATTAPAATATAPTPAPKPRLVSATLRATGIVWVCLVDDAGKRLVDAELLQPGTKRGPFESKRLRATFGNGKVSLRVNGRRVKVPPELANGIGYDIAPARVRVLGPDRRPSCS